MDLISFVILFLFVVSGFCLLSLLSPISPARLNYFSFLYFYNVLFSVVFGVAFVLMGWPHDEVINLISSENKIILSFLILLGILIFMCSLVFFGRMLSVDSGFVGAYLARPVNNVSRVARKILLLFYISLALVLCYFLLSLPYIPVLSLMTGEYGVVETAVMRTETVFALPPIMNFLRMILIPFLQIFYFYFLAEYLLRRRILYLFMSIISFFFAAFFLMYGGDKALVVFFIFGNVLFFVIYCGEISLKLLSVIFILAFGFICFLYLMTMDGLGDSVWISFLNRLIVSQLSGTYLSFQHFGDVEPFIGFGSQNASVLKLFSVEAMLRASERLVEYYYYDSYKAGLFKNMNSIYLHEAWANFGFWGFLFGSVWVGFLISLNFRFLTAFGKDPISVSFLVYFSYNTLSFSTSFNAFIFSVQFFIVAFFFLLFVLINQSTIRRA